MGRIVAKDLTISYGTRSIIQGLDIAIPDNKITTIIGPNGCGKSTLLKALCTLLPYSGVVELSGKDIATYRRRDSNSAASSSRVSACRCNNAT